MISWNFFVYPQLIDQLVFLQSLEGLVYMSKLKRLGRYLKGLGKEELWI